VAPLTRLLTADVGILTSVLDRLGSAQFVTCSALLDPLTIDQLDAIGSALAVARQPAMFSLTVTVPWNCLCPTLRLAPDSGLHFLNCVKPAAYQAAYQPVRPTEGMSAPPRTDRAPSFRLASTPTVDGMEEVRGRIP
jgi:hypothetical protein